MQMIDQSVYQTLARSLILQHHHPYKPQHTPSLPNQESNKVQYSTIKKTLKKMTIQQPATNKKEHPTMIETINQFSESPQHYSQVFERFNTGDLLKQPQLFQIHPYSKEEIGQELSFSASNKIIKSSNMQDIGQLQVNDHQIFPINMEDVILGPSKTPMKKEDYYENIKGMGRNMQKAVQKYKILQFRWYPIIFIANLFVLLTLLLAIYINEQIMWVIQSGLIALYFLIIYLSKVIQEMFTIRRTDNLQRYIKEITNIQGHFKFQIQCYHYAKIKNRTQKVITYKKSELFKPSISIDQSFSINIIDTKSSYIAIFPQSNFYFVDKQSQERFSSIFNGFVERNINDDHQRYSYSLEIESLKNMKGLYCPGRSFYFIFYIISGMIGLLYPFIIWSQSNTIRYQANIIKRLTISP